MSEPIYILKLGLENVRCFGEKAELDLSDGNGNWRQWTVIVGDNGLGKTTLLQILAGLEARDTELQNGTKSGYDYKLIEFYYRNSFIIASKIKAGISKVLFELNDNVEYEIAFHNTQGRRVDWRTVDFPINTFGYGANRFMSSTSLVEYRSENSVTLFDDDAKLINAEEWLLQLDYSASKESPVQEYAQKKRDQVKEILIELLPDVSAIRFTEPTKENLKSNIEFQTSFGWVKIHELSLGYKTMIAWMVDLAARMFDRYPDSVNPLLEPAIVLVDEIDLHLHPKWQRKIFEYLSEKFPRTQFVVTAHSPLVVQSAPKDANIVVLRKEDDHVVIDNDVESVQSWRLDQILDSDLFGYIPTRGPEVIDWMNERESLLRKQTLNDDEKRRLNELNRKAHGLPTADTEEDREAMDIIRKAANYLKDKVATE